MPADDTTTTSFCDIPSVAYRWNTFNTGGECARRASTSGPPPSVSLVLTGLWLDPWVKDVAAASDLLKPYDARAMRCYPMSTPINHVANDDADCSAPVELA